MSDETSVTMKMVKRILLTGILRQQQASTVESVDGFRAMLDEPDLAERFDAESIAALRDLLRAQEFYLTELDRITRTIEIK